MIEFIEISQSLRASYNKQLQDFEKLFLYPLGDDYFCIDHGKDYFCFFDRIGVARFFAALSNGQVIGLVAAIFRTLDIYNNGRLIPIWYICDLKIHPHYRGMRLVQKMLNFAWARYASVCKNMYAISMNSAKNGEFNREHNRTVRFAERLSPLDLRVQDNLQFYLLTEREQSKVVNILHRNFTGYSFISLSGVKELILQSTNSILDFMHFSQKQNSPKYKELKCYEAKHGKQQGRRYMLSLPASSSICRSFDDLGIQPIASACVLSNLEGVDWSFITSDEI